MTEIITIILTIGVGYVMGHIEELSLIHISEPTRH